MAADENLVTDLVPSEIACLDNSPGRINRTEVWISREEMVDFLEYEASPRVKPVRAVPLFAAKQNLLDASLAMRSKISLTNEFKIAIALLEIPVSGWTCFKTTIH